MSWLRVLALEMNPDSIQKSTLSGSQLSVTPGPGVNICTQKHICPHKIKMRVGVMHLETFMST